MNRRLNPELFNQSTSSADTLEPSSSMVATRNLEKELKAAKKKISQLESVVEVMQTQLRVSTESGDKRTEVFSKAISELEKDFRQAELSNNMRMDRMEGRIRDTQVAEGQVENMVARFNTSIMQFENKIAVLQKKLSEKEMTLMSYRRVIEQIVDEVEKLKNPASRPPRPFSS